MIGWPGLTGLSVAVAALLGPSLFWSTPAAAEAPETTFARGVIVHSVDENGSSKVMRRTAQRLVDPRVEVLVDVTLDEHTALLLFDQPQPVAVAEDLAADLQVRSDVLWAEPDVLIQPTEVTLPNDPLFVDQWSLWEGGEGADMSVRAPEIWGIDSGDPDVVIAVIDTGVAAHPDLAGRVIDGYDFVSDILMANDGNAWDPNPADPGDWVSAVDINSGLFPESCRSVTPSTWHGTHVAGIAAAQWNNGYGISGAAPNATIQNVRALGKCGGFISDIAAAVRWSAGDIVIDPDTQLPLPVNTTPAQVINLSLGGQSACTRTMADAVLTARALGSVVVAAAGNDSLPVSTHLPSNCPGVVAVAATDATGARASYSNYGVSAGEIFIAAPGGSISRGILSTSNTGATAPAQPSFDLKAGTSMATPLVSAAVALIVSGGITDAVAIEARLKQSGRAFAQTSSRACTEVTCGAGLLTFSLLADSITLTGERTQVRGRPGVSVDGKTLGLPAGELLTPYVKLPGQTAYQAGTGVRRVVITQGQVGEFDWQRRTGKKVYVYFRSESGEQSERVIIPANSASATGRPR